MGRSGETKVLVNQTLCPLLMSTRSLLGSTLWSVSPNLPGSLVLSSQASSVIHDFVRPLATKTVFSIWVLTFTYFLQWPIYWNAFGNKVKGQKKGGKMRKMKMERKENYYGNTDLSFLLLDTNKKLWSVRPHIFRWDHSAKAADHLLLAVRLTLMLNAHSAKSIVKAKYFTCCN